MLGYNLLVFEVPFEDVVTSGTPKPEDYIQAIQELMKNTKEPIRVRYAYDHAPFTVKGPDGKEVKAQMIVKIGNTDIPLVVSDSFPLSSVKIKNELRTGGNPVHTRNVQTSSACGTGGCGARSSCGFGGACGFRSGGCRPGKACYSRR